MSLKLVKEKKPLEFENFAPLQDDFRQKKLKADSWMMSYADVVTVLLCFFIIFYAIEKMQEKEQRNPLLGFSQQKGVLEEIKDGMTKKDFDYAINKIKEIKHVEVKRSIAFVDVMFKEIVFFKKGKFELTKAGKEIVDDVVSKLVDFKGQYSIEIQGYADKTPVKKSKKRWWSSNMELSVLRSLNVYSYLEEKSIPKQFMSVAGYGVTRSLKPNTKDIFDANRRISFRLQLLEKKGPGKKDIIPNPNKANGK